MDISGRQTDTPEDGFLPAAWERLGVLLRQRRGQLDARYRHRNVFAAEVGLKESLLADIENAKRPGTFRPETLARFEVAYQLAPGSIREALADPTLTEFPRRLGRVHSGSARLHAEGSLTVRENGVPVAEYETDWFELLPGGKALTADKRPIPPKPKGVELPSPSVFDPTSLPLHEVRIWLIEGLTLEERAGMVAWLRRRRQEERDTAALLRESNGPE